MILQDSSLNYAELEQIISKSKQINELRKFRNRIFHYEPIFNKSPEKYHNEILQSTMWISLSLYKINKLFDEFDNIYNEKDEIKRKIKEVIDE